MSSRQFAEKRAKLRPLGKFFSSSYVLDGLQGVSWKEQGGSLYGKGSFEFFEKGAVSDGSDFESVGISDL